MQRCEAEYSDVSAEGVLLSESYNLNGNPEDWESFADKAEAWVKNKTV